MYVELAARSNFSFLRGASSPQALVQRAVDLGYDTLAVTDCDGLYGIVRAHEEAVKQSLRLVVGSELTIDASDGDARPVGAVVVHVQDHDGYRSLCRILTESHARHPKGKPRKKSQDGPRNLFAGVPLRFVCENARGLFLLAEPFPEGGIDFGMIAEAFGPRASIGVRRHLDGEDRARARDAVGLARRYGLPLCATNAVLYARREDKPVLDVLHAIREGKTLDEGGRAFLPNAEAHLKAPAEMARLFADHPEWIGRSREVADACRFAMTELDYSFPCELESPAFPGETADEALRRLTYAGAKSRYAGGLPERVASQIEKEFALIAGLEVAPYFLSVHSIIEIARARDILCQGRGSAANSAVCYCLGVTAVDPARSNLLFERFLSAERREPPDIDVDFEHERREEVIQELYLRYGRDRAAMVCEVISYRGKSALREVGKAFGLSLEQVDRLSSLVAWWDALGDLGDARIRAAGFDPGDGRVKQVLHFAWAIQGFPRHLSIHVGGFVLSAAPLEEVAPVEPATMPERTIIPWDKDDLDTLGFFKVDVLGLGMLTAIRKTLAMVQGDERVRAGKALDQLAKIPPEDPVVYDALCKADTVGVFQIESRAQMSMLPRLKPVEFYDLVVEVAIVRPGPIQGGMVHPYLKRRNGEEPRDAPHLSLAPVLARTLGVPLFQEQVMQIAIVGAGYTAGEADQLRRDMAAWRKTGRLERHKERLFTGFAERGISREFAERLYAQIQGFGEYGFPESHAASFALLVYASSWLKVHHPAAFAVGLANSQPMGFYSVSTIFQDAQRHGVEILPVRVDKSDWDHTLEEEGGGRQGGNLRSIRVGLRQVSGLGAETGRQIEKERKARPFESVEDLASRAELKKNELEALAAAGALTPLIATRRQAIWKVHAPGMGDLFAGKELGDELPRFEPLTRAEELVLDFATTGLSTKDHPMKILRPSLPRRIKSSLEIAQTPHATPVQTAGMVICRQRPGTASGVVFVTMEDEHGFINLILYARVFERFRQVAVSSVLLLAHGKIEKEGDVVYVVVSRLEPLTYSGRSMTILPGMSRDFH